MIEQKKCQAPNCEKITRFPTYKSIYCSMHLARLQRHGTLDRLKFYAKLSKLPHEGVNDIIQANKEKTDKEVAILLREVGFENALSHHVKYRRKQLNIKKYEQDANSNSAVKRLAIKLYGKACEICGFNITVDAHHIIAKKNGGSNEGSNLTIVCPNCHALFERGFLKLKSRNDFKRVVKERLKLLRNNV